MWSEKRTSSAVEGSIAKDAKQNVKGAPNGRPEICI